MSPSEFDLTPHILFTMVDELPVAYQRAVLRTDPHRVDEVLAEARDILAKSSEPVVLTPRPDRGAGYLDVTGLDQPDALAVREELRKEGVQALELETAYVADDPDPERAGFKGYPAREGHGVTTRGAVRLVGLEPAPRGAAPAGRRPVVAVLDTPVSAHSWLGDGTGEDSFWSDARTVDDPWAPPFTLTEEAGDGHLSHAGHGTFIAGIVRQLAPDSRVLSLPVMQGNGVVEEEHILHALGWLRDRVTEAISQGRADLFVDVVNMSFGRYILEGRSPDVAKPLRDVLAELDQLGVQVVASAGNRPRATDVLPATAPGVVSVGALDPDGTVARYTSTGPWVSLFAPGSTLVSALPTFDLVPTDPEDPDGVAQGGPDPNPRASRTGQWSGTSFAAAWVSGALASRLIALGEQHNLAVTDLDAVQARRGAAVAAVAAELAAKGLPDVADG